MTDASYDPTEDLIVQPFYLAGEVITAYRATVLKAGTLFHADNTDPGDYGFFIGISTASGAIGAGVPVTQWGQVDNPAWAWTVGDIISIGVGGALVANAAVPTTYAQWIQVVGFALSATSIFVSSLPPQINLTAIANFGDGFSGGYLTTLDGRLGYALMTEVYNGNSNRPVMTAANSSPFDGVVHPSLLPDWMTVTALAAVTASRLVTVSSTGFRHADRTVAGRDASGFCLDAVANGNPGKVYGPGLIPFDPGFTGPAYLGTAGQIESSATTTSGEIRQYVGWAIDNVGLMFDPQMPTVLGATAGVPLRLNTSARGLIEDTPFNLVKILGLSVGSVQATEDIAANAFVNIFTSSGNPRIRNADASLGRNANGFVRAAVASGASGEVWSHGLNPVDPNTNGVVYLGNAGAFTTTPTTTAGETRQAIGAAIDNLGIMVDTQTPMIVGLMHPSPLIMNDAGRGVKEISTAAERSTFRLNTRPRYALMDSATATFVETLTYELSGWRTRAYDRLVSDLKDASVWTNVAMLYLLAADTAEAAVINLKSPGTYNLTATNSPTFTKDLGYTGNGTSSYLDSGVATNTLVSAALVGQDDMGMWVWPSSDVALDGAMDMGNTGATVRSAINPRTTAGKVQSRANDGTSNLSTATISTSVGGFGWSRTGSADYVQYQNGVALGTITQASVGVAASIVSILRSNANYSTRRLAAAAVTSGLNSTKAAALHAAVARYLGASGLGVPGF